MGCHEKINLSDDTGRAQASSSRARTRARSRGETPKVWSFHNPVKVVFGAGASVSVAVERLARRRWALVT
jgi:hypothetical protein